MSLSEYVQKYAIRGACQCGKCLDAVEVPAARQPAGHTVDLTFFKVAAADGATKEKLLELVQAELPQLLDKRPHGYIELGGLLDDQGLALMAIGLGGVLGAWKVRSPSNMLPDIPDELKQQLAGSGLVEMHYEGDKNVSRLA
jgi:hypothetical protein